VTRDETFSHGHASRLEENGSRGPEVKFGEVKSGEVNLIFLVTLGGSGDECSVAIAREAKVIFR
jgi:hypothetical protein